MAKKQHIMEIISEIIKRDHFFPGNDHFPLVIYKKAIMVATPEELGELFLKNGWKNIWIDGIYDFHHFHSNTHEALGIFSGEATVQFGGPNGPIFPVEGGDCIIIPAGVSHKNLKSSQDFITVGVYPTDIQYDMNIGDKEVAIKKIPLPNTDPLFGKDGPLFTIWS